MGSWHRAASEMPQAAPGPSHPLRGCSLLSPGSHTLHRHSPQVHDPLQGPLLHLTPLTPVTFAPEGCGKSVRAWQDSSGLELI